MHSSKETYKRSFVTLGFGLFFLLNGLFLDSLKSSVPYTALSFMIASVGAVGYLLFFWLFQKMGHIPLVRSWKEKEFWAIALLLGVIYQNGAIESYPEHTELTLLFSISLIFIGVFCVMYYRGRRKEGSPLSARKKIKSIFWIFSALAMGISTLVVMRYVFLVEGDGNKLVLLGNNDEWYTEILIPLFLFEVLLFVLVWGYMQFKINLTEKKTKGKIGKWKMMGLILGGILRLGTPIVIFVLASYGRVYESTMEILIPLYLLLLIAYGANWVVKQVKSIIQLKNENTQTELLHLKSQVNPHFFFNMLNNLYGWVDKDQKKAKELILKLSDMMRYSIYEGEKDWVPLEKEIDYLKNYIALHKMRYHKNIKVDFIHDIQGDGYKIMPLLFIILLENAFKHGVENLRGDAFVEIVLKAEEDDVYFMIRNNYDPEALSKQKGIGLKNLKRRLELMYPNKHTLFFKREEEIYNVELRVERL